MSIVHPDSGVFPQVSVIVPLHRDSEVFRRCLTELVRCPSDTSFEVLVVSDKDVAEVPDEVRHVKTGSQSDTSPAVKRDFGSQEARGGVLAFIDDDAYPRKDWLDQACKVLGDADVSGVGGPGLTPPESSWKQRLGGAVYESFLGSGPLRHRFAAVGRAHDSADLPAYNFLLRREPLETIGGWASTFYGGEDTKVCLELTQAGYRLRHDPNVVVYHFRRPVLIPHLRQVANVGRHRGHFVRRYPRTSRLPIYFLPALIALASGPASGLALRELFHRPRRTLRVGVAVWIAIAASAAKRAGPAAIAFPGVLVCHHLAYGSSFIRGLFGPEIQN